MAAVPTPATTPTSSGSRTAVLVGVTAAALLVVVVAGLAFLLSGGGSDDGSGSSDGGPNASAEAEAPTPEELPEGAIAVVVGIPPAAEAVEDLPYADCDGEIVSPDLGVVTRAEFECAFDQAVANAEMEASPRPGSEKYQELRRAAVTGMLEIVWIQGLAAEEGVTAGGREVAEARSRLIAEEFDSDAEFRDFVESSRFSNHDVNERFRAEILGDKLRASALDGVPKQRREDHFAEFIEDFESTWRARTVCAPAFVVEKCSNG